MYVCAQSFKLKCCYIVIYEYDANKIMTMYVLSYLCYVCAQLFISYVCMYVLSYLYSSVIYCYNIFVISYVCMCSVIYKLCMYVIS